MIVEVFGHAGAGKSTFAQLLASALYEAGVPNRVVEARGAMVDRVCLRRLLQIHGLFAAPQLTMAGVALLRACGVSGYRALGTLGGIPHRSKTIRSSDRPTEVQIVDEGVCHAIWAVLLWAQRVDERAVRRYLELAGYPKHAISLRPTRKVIESHLRAKDWEHGLLRLSPGDLGDTLARLDGLLDIFENVVEQSGAVVRLETTDHVAVALAVQSLLPHVQLR